MRGRCSIRRSCAARSADSFVKLNPVALLKNPVIFVVEVGAALTTVFLVRDVATGAAGHRLRPPDRPLALVHRAVRQLRRGDGRSARQGAGRHACARPRPTRSRSASWRTARLEQVSASKLRAGDVVLCDAGDIIPGDGEVIEGIATVDESVITGESAPVIRESGGDRSAVTGGTRVLSDQIRIRITSNPGETFLDRMIALVEGAERQKTPNEIALNILIAGLTLIFLLAVVTLQPFALYSVASAGAGSDSDRRRPGRAAGLPDPDDHRRPAVRHRHRRHGPRDAAQRPGDERQGRRGGRRRQHAAARQDRHHHARQPPGGGVPAGRRRDRQPSWPMRRSLSSLADETPEGRSIVVLAKEKYGLRGRDVAEPRSALHPVLGLHAHERRRSRRAPACARAPPTPIAQVRQGSRAARFRRSCSEIAERIARSGGTPLAVADGRRAARASFTSRTSSRAA